MLPVYAVVLLVEGISELLKHHYGVAIETWMLSGGGYSVEYFVDVCQVEVTAKQQISGTPVVATQERVDIVYPGASCSAVAQVTHHDLANVGCFGYGLLCGHFRQPYFVEFREYVGENILDSLCPHSPFSPHVFAAGLCVHIHDAYSGGFLSAVVLFLHHQIEFVEAIAECSVLLVVVIKRLAQADHRYSAFVFELFHRKNDVK